MQQVLGLLDQLLDAVARPFQLLLVRVKRVPEVGRVLETIGELQRQETHLEATVQASNPSTTATTRGL